MYRKKGRPSKKPPKFIFEMIYYNPSMTIYEIADYFKVEPQTIYNWASQFKKEGNINVKDILSSSNNTNL